VYDWKAAKYNSILLVKKTKSSSSPRVYAYVGILKNRGVSILLFYYSIILLFYYSIIILLYYYI
jgi:hypothetical protein